MSLSGCQINSIDVNFHLQNVWKFLVKLQLTKSDPKRAGDGKCPASCELGLTSTRLNPNWHEGRYFSLLVLFGSDFVSWIFIKYFQTFLEMKIDINWVNLSPCEAHCSKILLSKISQGGAKDDSSCQWGLRYARWNHF